jgi:hypothetical protein
MDAAAQAALLAQLQGEVQALQNAAAAAPAVNTAAAAAANPPVFTLAPALANTATFIDVDSVSGTKHFKGATEPLNKQPFDFADSADLQVFLDLVLKKSQVWGWNTIFTIPVTNVTTGLTTNHSLISKYAVIPLASVRTQVMSYYANPTKQAQDSFMACQCLLGSLTLDFLKLITADSTDYHLPPIVAGDGPVPAGPLLLKLIISQAHVDSRATVTHIRTSLTMLDAKMTELDSNIEAFNFYVKAQIKNLAAGAKPPTICSPTSSRATRPLTMSSLRISFVARKMHMRREKTSIQTTSWLTPLPSTRQGNLLTGGLRQPRNKDRFWPYLLRSSNSSPLPRSNPRNHQRPLPSPVKRKTSGPGRMCCPRKVNPLQRNLAANTTMSTASIIPINGYAIQLWSAVKIPALRELLLPIFLTPSQLLNGDYKPLRLWPLSLTMKTMILKPLVLMARTTSEGPARELSLFSVGHSFSVQTSSQTSVSSSLQRSSGPFGHAQKCLSG